MRISDWSSDVCSSDLGSARTRGHGADPVTSIGLHLTPELMRMGAARPAMRSKVFGLPSTSQFAGVTFDGLDRKSVVQGKSVSVRVVLGGRRLIKKTM